MDTGPGFSAVLSDLRAEVLTALARHAHELHAVCEERGVDPGTQTLIQRSGLGFGEIRGLFVRGRRGGNDRLSRDHLLLSV